MQKSFAQVRTSVREPAPTTPCPQFQCALPVIATQLARGCQQHSQEHSAIVPCELDELGLDDQPTELDQLARSLAPLHRPLARVTASSRSL